VPLIVDGGIPTRWVEQRSHSVSLSDLGMNAKCIRIALINNMPDPALEDTELQFFELLDAASGSSPVLLRLYSLSGVPRTDRGMPHLNKFYTSMSDFWNRRFDAVIMTGTEPHHADLREEPYWNELVKVLEWAEDNTVSTILSCLAAHAGVLHSDGIQRHALPDKQFGVFEFTKTAEHALTRSYPDVVRFPHSRWNEVRAGDLSCCGYSVLTESRQAGVDLFVKRKRKSLFVHFQGHPEYGKHTLLKEFRRDIKRFLQRERETYPSMPQGYFDADAAKLLSAFRERALLDRNEEAMAAFPDNLLDLAESSWHSPALCVYQNWLRYIASRSELLAFPALAGFQEQGQRKRSALR